MVFPDRPGAILRPEKDLELHDAIDDAEYRDRIEYLRRILVNELKDREEGYSDGTR